MVKEYLYYFSCLTYSITVPDRDANLYDAIVKCNVTLEPLGMKIHSGKMEQDGSNWIGLVNTCKDEVAKRSTHLTLTQLDFFKTVVR